MVAHFAAVAFTGFMIYVAWPGSSLFSWHPTLMAVAMGLLMFEAITVFSPSSSLIISWQRPTKANIHGYMMAASLFAAIAGFLVIYYNKQLNNKEHFTTWHGTMGFITLLWACVQTLGGLLLKYNWLIKSWKIRLVDMKLYHATSGLCAFTLVSVTLVLALFSDWFSSVATGTSWWGVFALLGCLSLTVMQQVTTAYLPQTRSKPKPITTKQGKRKEKKEK
ncbi:transmembrane reductase CYB561D2-like [Saccostrea echinata]|uniref:transmembrane reductase CYB561D2-like n=1 Tax=Saccostrea echinata TaxID=191078 RepID=UPI002A81F75B|nr:transmembrane reductase CYB561D2-like [Saccostrea echinata]